jgi:oligopeptide/dipeptide ABC transporter ATP-binding protein
MDSLSHDGLGCSGSQVEMPAGNAVLSVDELTVEFVSADATVRAVDRVSLDIRSGETVALVGESGSGKSVTSLAIMGLLAAGRARTSGRIDFRPREGELRSLLALPAKAMRQVRGREIAMIFQEPMTSLNPLQTVGTQVSEMLVIHGTRHRGAIHDLAAAMLAKVGLANPSRVMKSYPHELSGGMRQRVMIAMAMMCRPSLIIADEPTTALDVTIQAQIMDLFRALRDESRQSMLFITHDLGLVAEIASRVYVMYAGQIVESGSVNELFGDPKHPYTRGLLASSPRVDRPRVSGRPLHAIPGRMPDPARLPPGCRFASRCGFAERDRCEEMQVLERIDTRREVRCCRWRELGGAA